MDKLINEDFIYSSMKKSITESLNTFKRYEYIDKILKDIKDMYLKRSYIGKEIDITNVIKTNIDKYLSSKKDFLRKDTVIYDKDPAVKIMQILSKEKVIMKVSDSYKSSSSGLVIYTGINSNNFTLSKAFTSLFDYIRKVPINEEVIEEGIKYFKTSKQLYKLYDKLISKAHFLDRDEEQKELISLANRVKRLGTKFEKVENSYAEGSKSESISKYNDLKNDYSDILKILSKEKTKSILKSIQSIAYTLMIMTIPYIMFSRVFPNLSKTNPSNMIKGDSQVASEKIQENGHAQMAVLLKRAGALTACGIPVRMANSLTSTALNSYQNDEKLINALETSLSNRIELA
jgi:hypothetical protein